MLSKFEELIRENERDLQRIRKIYFPLIEDRIITGYNLYPELFDYSQGRLFLNYLHSDLKPEDKHFQELFRILKTEGFLEERIIINTELVNTREIIEREAAYITSPDWKDPENMRYFDENGKELTKDKVKSLGKDIIGEALQYDLLIRITDERELRKLIDLFKRYTSKDKLDKDGRKILEKGTAIENINAISKAYYTPFLICTTTNNKKPENLQDFLTINQFNIPEMLGNIQIILSTLVRKNTKEFQKILNQRKIKIQIDKKYLLRAAVEGYIDA